MTPPEMVVPLVDLRAAFLPIRDEVLREFDAILKDMNLLLGPNVQAFEREFASYCGVSHGIAVSSGTDALFAALAACGIGPGDEVVAPSHTFFATIEAIVHTGAMPVLVDVEPETLTLDPDLVRAAITDATRAILPVHLYGSPADMQALTGIAEEHDLRVIEDAAQAHGALTGGRRCGGIGDAGCFSFYFTKNLGALGEGGFVTTSDDALAERVRLLRHHGHVSKYEHAIVGHNLRMDELQAAVLRIKLRGLDAGLARRRTIADRYTELLADTPVRPVPVPAECAPGRHLYPVRVQDRDALMAHLSEAGVGTGIHYAVPAHLQPAMALHPHRCGPMPVTEAVCGELLSLPLYPELRDEQVEYVAKQVLRFFERGAGAVGAGASRA